MLSPSTIGVVHTGKDRCAITYNRFSLRAFDTPWIHRQAAKMPEFIYKKPVQELTPLKPWLTMLMVLGCLWAYYDSTAGGLLSSKMHAFSADRYSYFMDSKNFPQLLSMMFSATFSQASFPNPDTLHAIVNITQMVLSMYFLWVFGSTAEIRLGYLRYLLVIVSSTIAGWVLLGYEIAGINAPLYLGPGILTAGIVGAYMNFLPEKKISPGGSIGRTYKIVSTTPPPDPSSHFSVSPWTLFVLFGMWQLILHFFILAHIAPPFDNIRVLPAIAAAATGFVVALVAIMMATIKEEGHPLQRLTILQYHELRNMDLNHEQSIVGAARLMSLPEESVKKWLQTAKSKLPPAPK